MLSYFLTIADSRVKIWPLNIFIQVLTRVDAVVIDSLFVNALIFCGVMELDACSVL